MRHNGMPTAFKKGGFYYGWLVVAACALATFVEGGITLSMGVFFKPLMEDFGWSRAGTSVPNTAFLIARAFSMFFMGWLADRHGPRLTLGLVALLTGVGLALSSQVNSMGALTLTYITAGIGVGGGWSVPAATAQRWFVRRRGLVLGIVSAGIGVGGLVFAPLMNYLIATYGWRTTFLLLGGLSGAVMVLAASVMHHDPASKGLQPYGSEGSPSKPNSGETAPDMGLTTRQALRSWAFWGLTAVFVIGQLPATFIIVHFVPYAVDQGFSKAAAAGALGVISGMFIPGRLLMGVLAERIGWRLSLSLTNLGLAASFVWLATGGGMTVIYGFVLGYGLMQGARVPVMVGNVSHFFGLRSLGQLIGLLTGVSMMAGALAPLAAGVVYDKTGSYLPATIVSIFCFVVAGLLILFVKPPIVGKGPA